MNLHDLNVEMMGCVGISTRAGVAEISQARDMFVSRHVLILIPDKTDDFASVPRAMQKKGLKETASQ